MVSRYVPTDARRRHRHPRLRRQPTVAAGAVHPHGGDQARHRPAGRRHRRERGAPRGARPPLPGAHPRRQLRAPRTRSSQPEVASRLEGLPTFFCGRLATYTYIDQDQAIAASRSGCADEVLATLGRGNAMRDGCGEPIRAWPWPSRPTTRARASASSCSRSTTLWPGGGCDVVLVVVDDCSTDGTLDAVEDGARQARRASSVVSSTPRNGGHGPAVLEAYRLALDTGAELRPRRSTATASSSGPTSAGCSSCSRTAATACAAFAGSGTTRGSGC